MIELFFNKSQAPEQNTGWLSQNALLNFHARVINEGQKLLVLVEATLAAKELARSPSKQDRRLAKVLMGLVRLHRENIEESFVAFEDLKSALESAGIPCTELREDPKRINSALKSIQSNLWWNARKWFGIRTGKIGLTVVYEDAPGPSGAKKYHHGGQGRSKFFSLYLDPASQPVNMNRLKETVTTIVCKYNFYFLAVVMFSAGLYTAGQFYQDSGFSNALQVFLSVFIFPAAVATFLAYYSDKPLREIH